MSETQAAVSEDEAAVPAAADPADPADTAGGAAAPYEAGDLVDDHTGVGQASLENVLEIPVTVTVEIGSTQIAIRNLLQLNQGSVVELDRLAGEPLNVLVNGTLIAHGEVVVINDKYGIRLTDVISAQQRIRKLQ